MWSTAQSPYDEEGDHELGHGFGHRRTEQYHYSGIAGKPPSVPESFNNLNCSFPQERDRIYNLGIRPSHGGHPLSSNIIGAVSKQEYDIFGYFEGASSSPTRFSNSIPPAENSTSNGSPIGYFNSCPVDIKPTGQKTAPRSGAVRFLRDQRHLSNHSSGEDNAIISIETADAEWPYFIAHNSLTEKVLSANIPQRPGKGADVKMHTMTINGHSIPGFLYKGHHKLTTLQIALLLSLCESPSRSTSPPPLASHTPSLNTSTTLVAEDSLDHSPLDSDSELCSYFTHFLHLNCPPTMSQKRIEEMTRLVEMARDKLVEEWIDLDGVVAMTVEGWKGMGVPKGLGERLARGVEEWRRSRGK